MEALTKDVATLQKKGRVSGKRNAAALAGLLAKVRHCKATVARAGTCCAVVATPTPTSTTPAWYRADYARLTCSEPVVARWGLLPVLQHCRWRHADALLGPGIGH